MLNLQVSKFLTFCTIRPLFSPSSLINPLLLLCRQPKANERLAINDILTPLQKPDFRILNWTSEETKMYSNEARTLGANLDAGNRLHMDLQRTYLILNPSDREVVTNDIGGTGNTSTIEKEEMSTVGLNKDDDSYS